MTSLRQFLALLLGCVAFATSGAVSGRADQAAASPGSDPAMLFAIYEPAEVPATADEHDVAIDPKKPLLVVRSVRTGKMLADGEGAWVQLTPEDTKVFASLTRAYLGKSLILKTAGDAGEVMQVADVIDDGILIFNHPLQWPIAAYLRDRLGLKP